MKYIFILNNEKLLNFQIIIGDMYEALGKLLRSTVWEPLE